MSNLLNQGRGTAYIGTSASQPPNCNFNSRDPLSSDSQNYSLLDLWINTSTQSVFMLTSLQGNAQSRGQIANWQQIEFNTEVISPNAIRLPATDAALTRGYISIGGVVQMQAYGISNLFLADAGNTTLTVGNATDNIGIGFTALASLTTGNENVGIGTSSLGGVNTGRRNVAVGYTSANFITSGSNNVAVGYLAGSSWITGPESSNIAIGATGVNGESNTCHIGEFGNGAGQQEKCILAGCVYSTGDDLTGLAGATGLSNSTATAAGGGAVNFQANGGGAINQSGWIRFYINGAPAYVPYFLAI